MSCQAALALASPMYDHPRHLKPKRIGHVLIAAQQRTQVLGGHFSQPHVHTCTHTVTSVSLENFLGISAVQCCMCGTVVGFSLTVRFFHQDSNKPSFRYVTVEQMFQTGRELIHRAMLHVWHSCQSQACWNALSSKEV